MRIQRWDVSDFRRQRFALQDFVRRIPVWSGNMALNFYKDSWRRQGYIIDVEQFH